MSLPAAKFGQRAPAQNRWCALDFRVFCPCLRWGALVGADARWTLILALRYPKFISPCSRLGELARAADRDDADGPTLSVKDVELPRPAAFHLATTLSPLP